MATTILFPVFCQSIFILFVQTVFKTADMWIDFFNSYALQKFEFPTLQEHFVDSSQKVAILGKMAAAWIYCALGPDLSSWRPTEELSKGPWKFPKTLT